MLSTLALTLLLGKTSAPSISTIGASDLGKLPETQADQLNGKVVWPRRPLLAKG